MEKVILPNLIQISFPMVYIIIVTPLNDIISVFVLSHNILAN